MIAIEQGADFIEPDLVSTADGVLIARHENEIGGTTDFTLAEIKTLRARERLPGIRPHNTRFDGLFEVPSLEEILNLVRAMNERRARDALVLGRPRPRPIGLYPETKHPSYFRDLGLPLETRLIDSLERHGYGGPGTPVFIQSFEVRMTPLAARAAHRGGGQAL